MLIINFIVGKPSKYHLNQVIKINITTNGANQHCVPPHVMHLESTTLLLW